MLDDAAESGRGGADSCACSRAGVAVMMQERTTVARTRLAIGYPVEEVASEPHNSIAEYGAGAIQQRILCVRRSPTGSNSWQTNAEFPDLRPARRRGYASRRPVHDRHRRGLRPSPRTLSQIP